VSSPRDRTRLFAGLAALVVVSLLCLSLVTARRSAERRIGVSMAPAEGGIAISGVGAGRPADRAGVREGDVVLSVDGAATPNERAYDRASARFARDRSALFVLRRGGQTIELQVAPGTPFEWRDALVNGIGAVAYLALALLALYQARGDLRARLLFLFALAVALELANPSSVIGNPALATVTQAFFYLLTGIQFGIELHLASVIPQRRGFTARWPWVPKLYYIVGLGVGCVVSATYVAERFGKAPFPWSTQAATDVMLVWGLPVWAVLVTALLAAPAVRFPEPQGRQQAALVLAGVLPWTAYVLASFVLKLRDIPLPDWLQSLEPWVLIVYPIAVFTAIFRYHLFDMELVVRRSLLYTALTGTIVALFYSALWVGGAVFGQIAEGGHASVWVVSGVTLLLGLLFTPLHRALQNGIDRRFFPERYEMRQRLIALAGELAALGKVPLMGRRLVERLCEIFDLQGATLLLADPRSRLLVSVASRGGAAEQPAELSLLLSPDEPGIDLLLRARRPLPAERLTARSHALAARLHAVNAELVVPLISQDALVGALLLGGKNHPPREYRAEELELLNLLAHHVTVVFENARLFESATYEGLTGLLRREAVLEVLDKELQRAARYARPLTIGMADLDHFKQVNDQYGHLTGDALLKRVAQALAIGLRSADSVGRYGGEEFLLVLPETEIEGAIVVAEKVRGLVESASVPLEGAEGTASVTVSIGLASLRDLPPGPRTAQDLLVAADRSLYRAKQTGRNRVEPSLVATG
jgi:diguanylate cyclase (GGDEF)-like protein